MSSCRSEIDPRGVRAQPRRRSQEGASAPTPGPWAGRSASPMRKAQSARTRPGPRGVPGEGDPAEAVIGRRTSSPSPSRCSPATPRARTGRTAGKRGWGSTRVIMDETVATAGPRRASRGQPLGEGVVGAHVVAADEAHGHPSGRTSSTLRVRKLRLGFAAQPQSSALAAPRTPSQPMPPSVMIRGPGVTTRGRDGAIGRQLASPGRSARWRAGASHGRDDADPAEAQAVSRADRGRLVGETGAVQCGIQEITRGVAGEHTPRAIGAIGCGSQPDDEDLGRRVTEGGTGGPSRALVGEADATPALASDRLTPGHQAGTGSAHRDSGLELGQVDGRSGEAAHLPRGSRDRGVRRCRVAPATRARARGSRTAHP